MSVYIPKIPWLATHSDVEHAISAELQAPEFSPNPAAPLNFHIRLWNKKGRKGMVTLPSEEISQRFLRTFGRDGTKTLRVLGTKLLFYPSDKPPDPSVLHYITSAPYGERQRAVEEKDRLAGVLESNIVDIQKIQFGWDCRDGTFSIEWEHVTTSKEACISFLAGSRQIVIWITPDLRIVISFSQISRILTHEHYTDSGWDHIVFLLLYIPPAFHRLGESSALDTSGEGDVETKGEWHRLHALPLNDSHSLRAHESIAPYLSRSIRLVCASSEGPTLFTDLVHCSGLNVAVSGDFYECVRANLFSEESLLSFREWMLELPAFFAYIVESLLTSNAADPTELVAMRPEIDELVSEGMDGRLESQDFVATVIRDFSRKASILFRSRVDNLTLVECFQQCKSAYNPLRFHSIHRHGRGIFLCHHVVVTPTRVLLDGPVMERSNRVVRSFPAMYHQNFLRVSFVDEGKMKLEYDGDYNLAHYVQQRINTILKGCLRLSGRELYFLAYSQSALRSHSTWFLHPFTLPNGSVVNVPRIIKGLGSFSDLGFDEHLMHCSARYAARISQAFTTTEATSTTVEDLEVINDIVRWDSVLGVEWNFTDGVGTMSPEFAQSISVERRRQCKGLALEATDYSRAIQIRFEGSKGVLSVDHRLTGKKVCLRPSMIKFAGTKSNHIDIAQVFDKSGEFYLNRHLILIFEGLGVSYEVFNTYQEAALREVNGSTVSIGTAVSFLKSMDLGTAFRFPSVLHAAYKRGLSQPEDSFYRTVMQYARHDALRGVKYKSRISVPGAWNLVGIADVHDYLEANQVFACISQISGELKYLEGPTLITRSPTIHPGDVQIVQAIGRPPTGSCYDVEPLVNTVVFSIRGSRPVFSCLGGGDLDGDEYALISLKENPGLSISPYSPSAYTPAERHYQTQRCTHHDIADFFSNYITSDILGYISTTWRLLADERGIFHPDCLKLADLHSTAVDYPKSGTPVCVDAVPRRPEMLPDWQAPETMTVLDKSRYYESQSTIGRLFRAVDLPVAETNRFHRTDLFRDVCGQDGTNPFANESQIDFTSLGPFCQTVVQEVLAYMQPESYQNHLPGVLSDLSRIFISYRFQLQGICTVHALTRSRHAMLTEEEVFIGTIVSNTRQPWRRADHIKKIRDETAILVDSVRELLLAIDDVTPEMRLFRSYTAWLRSFSADPGIFGLSSFGWIALGIVFEITGNISGATNPVRIA